MPNPAKTIGLTGGIGSGKSTVAAILVELGAFVIHADEIGHQVYAPGTPGCHKVVEAFGPDILSPDGTIDRKRLGQIVFSDPGELARLNAIVHPLIRDEARRRIAEHRGRRPDQPIVLEAALLIEASWATLVDEVWVVTAPAAEIVRRVAAQRGLSPGEIEARMHSQLDDQARRERADVVIDNRGAPAELRRQVETLWRNRLSA